MKASEALRQRVERDVAVQVESYMVLLDMAHPQGPRAPRQPRRIRVLGRILALWVIVRIFSPGSHRAPGPCTDTRSE